MAIYKAGRVKVERHSDGSGVRIECNYGNTDLPPMTIRCKDEDLEDLEYVVRRVLDEYHRKAGRR